MHMQIKKTPTNTDITNIISTEWTDWTHGWEFYKWLFLPLTAALQSASASATLQLFDNEQWPLRVCSSPIEDRGGAEINVSFEIYTLQAKHQDHSSIELQSLKPWSKVLPWVRCQVLDTSWLPSQAGSSQCTPASHLCISNILLSL